MEGGRGEEAGGGGAAGAHLRVHGCRDAVQAGPGRAVVQGAVGGLKAHAACSGVGFAGFGSGVACRGEFHALNC